MSDLHFCGSMVQTPQDPLPGAGNGPALAGWLELDLLQEIPPPLWLFYLQVNDSMIFFLWDSWFSAAPRSPFSHCSLSNPLRFCLMFAFSSYLSNRLIFPLLSSVRTSHFKPANQRIQEAGHTLETSTKKRKSSATFESSWKGWTSVHALRERQPKEEAAGSQNLQRLLQERRLTGQLGNASHALVGHLYSLVQGESSQVSLKHSKHSPDSWQT